MELCVLIRPSFLLSCSSFATHFSPQSTDGRWVNGKASERGLELMSVGGCMETLEATIMGQKGGSQVACL